MINDKNFKLILAKIKIKILGACKMGLLNNQKIVCIICLFCSLSIIGVSKYLSRRLIDDSLNVYSSNKNSTECRNRTIDEFPNDFMTKDQRKNGGIVVHIFLTIYLFCAIAIVCDEYFVHSLNRISKDLKLRDDVAGATFMAAGSSSPELFTSLIGVLIAKSDVGVGTIVGSAVFNVLFIVSICALAAKTVLYIDWFPITRDCFYYLIAIGALIFCIRDGFVHWYEAIAMLLLYIGYILIMYFNERIEFIFKSKCNFIHNYFII